MAHEGLWQRLIKLNAQQTAVRANCRYISDPDRFFLTLLNTEYVVNLAEKQIFSCKDCSGPRPADFLEQLCILAYLINAKDLPLANKLVRAESLPEGQFFFRGLHRLPTEKLERAFGTDPQWLYQVGQQFAATQCEFGDASIQLYVLPRIPLTIIVWGQSQEFPARASILFDQTAAEHLPLDALSVAVELTVNALVSAAAGP